MESARFLPVTFEDLATVLLKFLRYNLENFYVHHQHTHAFMHFPISGHMQFTLTSNDQPASNHHRRAKLSSDRRVNMEFSYMCTVSNQHFNRRSILKTPRGSKARHGRHGRRVRAVAAGLGSLRRKPPTGRPTEVIT